MSSVRVLKTRVKRTSLWIFFNILKLTKWKQWQWHLCSADESKLYSFGMTWEWVDDKFYSELLYLALKKSNAKAILANVKKDFILYSTLRTHLRLNQTHIKHTCQISPLRPETFRPIIWITKLNFCTKQASYLYIKHNSKSNIKHQVSRLHWWPPCFNNP